MTKLQTNSLRANTIAQSLPLFIGYALNLLVTPYIVYRIGLHGFGVWSITGAVAQYAAVFDLGVSRSVTRFVALRVSHSDDHGAKRVVGVGVIVVGSLAITILVVALTIGPSILKRILQESAPDGIRLVLVCSCIILAGGLLSRVAASASFGRGRMVAMNIALAFQTSAMVLGGAAGALIEPTLISFATGGAVGALIGLACTLLIALKLEGRSLVSWPRWPDFREIVSYGVKGQSTLVADLLVFQSAKIVIGIFLGASAAGAYELGSRVALGARAFGSASVGALVPRLTDTYGRGGINAVNSDYVAYARKFSAVSVLPIAVLTATAPTFVVAWLGFQDTDVVVSIVILGLAFMLNVVTGTATAAALAIGRAGIVARSAFATSAVCVVLLLPATKFFGVAGALLSISISVSLGSAYGIVLASRAVGTRPALYFRAVSPLILASVTLVSASVGGLLLLRIDERVPAAVATFASLLFTFAAYTMMSIKFGWISPDNLEFTPRKKARHAA